MTEEVCNRNALVYLDLIFILEWGPTEDRTGHRKGDLITAHYPYIPTYFVLVLILL